MWANALDRYLGAIGRRSSESILALEMIDPKSLRGQMPRIASRYADFFRPYEVSHARYPLTRLGTYARLDHHYLPHWVDLKSLLARLLQAIDLPTPSPRPTTADLVAAIGLIGSLTYSAEWVSDPETAADLDNGASAPSVFDSNFLLAVHLIRRLKDRAARPVRVLDIGVGRGNTILPVLEQLAAAQCPHVDVSLLDISTDSLDKTAARLERVAADTFRHTGSQMSVQVREIIPCNLVELERSVASRPGNYDVIVSGGTLFHSADKERIFSWARRSLRSNGIFILWDWFAPCWAAPRLVAGAHSRYLSGDLYEISPDEIAAVEQTWLHGWLGPRGYFNYRNHGQYIELRTDFLRHMASLRAGEPFSFVSWLQTIADSYPEPTRPGHYFCIEGYSSANTYFIDSARAGLEVTEALTLNQLRKRYGEPPSHVGSTDSYHDTIKIIALERSSRRCMEDEN